jgi:hypothetical protein
MNRFGLGLFTLVLASGLTSCNKSKDDKAAAGSATAIVTGSGSAAGPGSAATGSGSAVGSGSAAGSATAAGSDADDPDSENSPRVKAAMALLKDENIGGLKLGMTDNAVIAILGKPSKKETPVEEAATGDIVADWSWAKAGVTVTFADAKKKPIVNGIRLEPAATLKTSKGVGIGSTRQQLDAAYQAGHMKDDDTAAQYVVGTHYFGMVFMFDEGKDGKSSTNVTSVYWGTLAE